MRYRMFNGREVEISRSDARRIDKEDGRERYKANVV